MLSATDVIKRICDQMRSLASKCDISFLLKVFHSLFDLTLLYLTISLSCLTFNAEQIHLYEIPALFLAYIGIEIAVPSECRISTLQQNPLHIVAILFVFILVTYAMSPDETDKLVAILCAVPVYYYLIKPIINVLVSAKNFVIKSYQKRLTILVIEINHEDLIQEALEYLSDRYQIAFIVNLTNQNIDGYKKLKNLKALDRYFSSIKNILAPNNIRQIIYITEEFNRATLETLLEISALYNVKIFRTPDLSDIAKYDVKSHPIVPLTIRDLSNKKPLSSENRKFLMSYCMGKSIWISYNDEPLIQALITEVAKSSPKFITIFVTSEQQLEYMELLLKDFNSLPFSIKLGTAKDELSNKDGASPDIIFYPVPLKSAALGFDNIQQVFRKNVLECADFLTHCKGRSAPDIFLFSDINAMHAVNWLGITHRIAEVITTSISPHCHIIRAPFSSDTDLSYINKMQQTLSNSHLLDLRNQDLLYSFPKQLNLFINAINKSLQNTGSIITVGNQPEIKISTVQKLFLNLYGLTLSEGTEMPCLSEKGLEPNVFEALNINLNKMVNDDLYLEDKVFQDQDVINTLLNAAVTLLENNDVSGIMDLSISFIKRVYQA